MLLIFSNVLIAQTFNPDYQDGKIYYKYKDNVVVNIPVNSDRSVDLDHVPMLDELRSKYSIEAMSRPFDFNNDPKLLRTFMLEFEDYKEIKNIINDLSINPDLEFVEMVPYSQIYFKPNDSLYNLLNGPSNWNWHLDLINAEGAWDITQGSADINVAVVDNAVWVDHPDLADKIVAQRDTQRDTNDANPPGTGDLDAWSHGTHVSGLVAASTNNEIGVAGIGFNVSLIAVKAANNGNPNGVYGYPGIQWAANNGADVINMSWGGPGYSQANQNLITAIYNTGIVLFAAAGNDNSSSAHYPSAYQNVISVASINYNDIKSSFSNYGFSVDISSPGGSSTPGPNGVLSTYYNETSMGFYDYIFGTSMASPVAAGLGGLVLSVNPDLTPDDVEDILKNTAVDIDDINPNYAGQLGAGRIDAYEAVKNTPFAPEADFSTPVTVIMPGTSINFTDHSVGVPDDWNWSFEGGSPSSSSNQNPTGITYNSTGTFEVSLTVTNSYGSDELVMYDYITVTNTPSPYVDFNADNTMVCLLESISFTDLSLYDPTSWLWSFDPSTVSFIDGTSETSQNPVVQFESPGYYTVTLSATNQHGTSELSMDDYVFIQGIDLPFSEDFESGESMYFTLIPNEKANIAINKRGAAPGGEYGLHFTGNTAFGGWSGGGTNTTPDQAWGDNLEFNSFAVDCKVDATGVSALALSLDLRQTYSLGPKTSWFRVLADGTPMNDFDGIINFNPETNEDPFVTKVFDLSDFANSYFSLHLNASCYLFDMFFEMGDNVFVDNIGIYNFTGTDENNVDKLSLILYPVPADDFVNLSLNNGIGDYKLRILNIQGQEIYSEEAYAEADNTLIQIDISDYSEGIYLINIISEKGIINKKLIKR